MIRVAAIVSFALTGLSGCDDSSVAVCFSTSDHFCNLASIPVADAGPDQEAAAGDVVVLDGSDSHSGLGASLAYAWTQTGGTNVTLVDANRAKASFVAPDVATDEVLAFRLTVVDSANNADSSDTRVTVTPVSPVTVALQLFDGPLRPQAPWPPHEGECPSATDALPANAAAAQLGLWLAGRTLALAKGFDHSDPSQWLDFVRVLVTEHAAAAQDTAGQLESFGFVLIGSALADADPALQLAIGTHLSGAPMLDDPAALLVGRTRVRGGNTVRIEPADPEATVAAARNRLLAVGLDCVTPAAAIDLTAAGLVVFATARGRIEN